MKIGVLGCGFNCHQDLVKVLEPWVDNQHWKQKGIIFDICVSSFLFKEYKELGYESDNSETIKILEDFKTNRLISNYFTSNEPKSESEARDLSLKFLLKCGVDYIWLLDLSDEFYTREEIEKIINYVKRNEFITWFGINFKNYIFDGKTWLDGFCPPRIFRTTINGLSLSRCYWDNDFIYKTQDGQEVNYKQLANLNVPANLAHIRHDTWLHSNGKKKVEYQMKHFGMSSYKWNEEKQELEMDNTYFLKNGLPIPTIHKE